jgi:two-component system, chemotaxis family, protein-glutamate methylesterase/glutaminase
MPGKARILIVDDSRCFRSALEEALSGYDDIAVVGSVWNGARALEFIRATPPDLVTLDVSMPGMDGLQTLRAIQNFNSTRAEGPPVGVIMVSVHTRPENRQTMEALQGGAFDFVHKPAGDSFEGNIQDLGQQLVAKIRHWRGSRSKIGESTEEKRAGDSSRDLRSAARGAHHAHRYRAVLIAVSTGGPAALLTLLPALCERIDLPILIVQHWPHDLPEMMTTLVNNISSKCRHKVTEARDGAAVQPGAVYFAPVDRHLVLRPGPSGSVLTMLTEQPPENNFRPSADVLFRSAAHVYGGDVVVLILTGMLHDGTSGLDPLKRVGAHVIVQDEASSVVWGMPGSAVAAGLVDEIVSLDRIPEAVEAVVRSGRRP